MLTGLACLTPGPRATALAAIGHAGPNLLVVTLDTTRADHLGAYGHAGAHTPVLDRLAAGGILFREAYASAPLTLPSHSTLFTGLEPPEHGLRINGARALDPGVTTLAEVLHDAGYRTAAMIAAHVLDARYGLAQGFETYDDRLGETRPQPVKERLSEYRAADKVVDAALAWLDADDATRPFFLWVHLYDAHMPQFGYDASIVGEALAGAPSYDGEIAFVDQQVGRLLEALARGGHAEDTLVVVVGDHGEGLGDHGDSGHGYLLNREVLRVPLIIAQPGVVPDGREVAELVRTVDVFPTILDLLRIDSPRPHGRGRSLVLALDEHGLEVRPAYAEARMPYTSFRWSPLQSITTDRWTYVRTTRPELYDRTVDPEERTNRAAVLPEVVQALESELRELEGGLTRGQAVSVAIREEDRLRLEALGYVEPLAADETDDTASPPSGLPDMKDMLRVRDMATWLNEKLRTQQLSSDDFRQRAAVLVKKSPGTPRFRYLYATALLQGGDATEAVEQLEEAVRVEPEFAEAYANLGRALLRLGRPRDAKRHLERALALNPALPEAHLNLGTIYALRRSNLRAQWHYKQAIAARPRYADAQVNLGNLLVRAGKPRVAERYYRRALASRPRFAVAHYNLARLLSERDQGEEAEEHYRRAIGVDPNFIEARLGLGQLLAERGDDQRAIDAYSDALAIDPRAVEVLDNLAAAYMTVGRADDAVRTGEQAAAQAEAAGKQSRAREIEARVRYYRSQGG